MIKINLLPENLSKERIIIPKGLLIIYGLILIIILFVSHVTLSNIFAKKERRLEGFKDEWYRISALQEETSDYKERLKVLEKRSKIINHLMAERVIWSKKLNELSNLVIDGIWLTKLEFTGELLLIEGSVYSENKDEEAIIGNFMGEIKKDTSFFKDFQDIELIIIKRKEGDIDHVNFVIFCALKEEDLESDSRESERK